MSLSNTILQPDQFENLSEEVEEEQSLTMLSSFFDKVWSKFDDETSIDNYYNF